MNSKVRKMIVRLLSTKYINQGYSEVAAEDLVSRKISRENKNYPKKVRKIAKRHGFLPATVLALGITEDNYREYLSDIDYYRLTPLNGIYHPWVNNKITLKYLLGDLASLMPKYFYQILGDGQLLKLFECPEQLDDSAEGVLALLKKEKSLAIKRTEGYGGVGFYKACIDAQGVLRVNDEEFTEERFVKLVNALSNYLIMEYLECAGLPAKIYPKTANSIRIIWGKVDGKQYEIGNFIKFGDKSSGYVDNLTSGGVSCPIDADGRFNGGYTKIEGVMLEIAEHPDTHVVLEGKLAEWQEIRDYAQKVMERLPQLSYCGFDFVISDKGIKLLEINDMSGLLTLQKNCPLLKYKEDNFYLKRLAELKA